MRPYRQTHWHKIPFSTFFKTDAYHIAGSEFYNRFYHTFFQKYSSWDSLDQRWMEEKRELAHFIKSHIPIEIESKTLSIGCGLGAVERELVLSGVEDLDVTEISETPLRWLKSTFPKLNTYTGFFPSSIPFNKTYRLIYLSAVEYCFNQQEFKNLLRSMRPHLAAKGKCLIISASCERFKKPKFKWWLREWAERTLMFFGFRKGQQLWGYMRTPEEIILALKESDFDQIQTGWLPSGLFWATGTTPT